MPRADRGDDRLLARLERRDRGLDGGGVGGGDDRHAVGVGADEVAGTGS